MLLCITDKISVIVPSIFLDLILPNIPAPHSFQMVSSQNATDWTPLYEMPLVLVFGVLGEQFLYWSFVSAFCNRRFVPRSFRIWCKGKSETAVFQAACHIDEYQLFLVVTSITAFVFFGCHCGWILYCVWSSFYISAASQIIRLTENLRLHLLIETKNYIQMAIMMISQCENLALEQQPLWESISLF